jgi:hypothetical protein
MRQLNLIISYGFLAVALLVLSRKGTDLLGVVMFTPIILGPFLINTVLAHLLRTVAAARVLFIASLLFIAWASFVFVQAFILHPDAQSAIALLFIGIWAFPVMAVLQAAAFVLHRRAACPMRTTP